MGGQAKPAVSAWSSFFYHVRYENLVAGVSGGVLSNLALHPLDLVKIRFAGESRAPIVFICLLLDRDGELRGRGRLERERDGPGGSAPG